MRNSKKASRRAFSRAEIAAFVRLIRKLIRVHHRTSPNLLEVFAQLQRLFPKLRLRIVPDNVSPFGEARAYPESWIIKIRQGIADGLLRGDAGARWTFAHELGHVLLRHPGKPFRNRKAAQDVLEREAHIFAAEFLAPSELVAKYRSAQKLQRHFQISFEAAQRRVSELNSRQSIKASPSDTSTEVAKIEEAIPEVCEAVAATLAESPQSLAAEPFRDNLFSTSAFVAKAADLLRSSYESLYPSHSNDEVIHVASLAAAIVAFRPIREIGGSSPGTSGQIAKLNEVCAIKVVSKLLGLNTEQLRRATPDNSDTAPLSFPADYLRPLIDLAEELIVDSSTTIHIFQMPSYFDYNDRFDISWAEINGLAKIINLLALLKSAPDAGP